MKVFVDMDGVLVDFHKGIMKKYNIPTAAIIKFPKPLSWFWLPELLKMKPEEILNQLDTDFWKNLDWMEEGEEILDIVEKRFGKENIALMTDPLGRPQSIHGKIDWIIKNLPEYENKLVFTSCKYFWAYPDALLIDDSDRNTDDFERHGGRTIIVPRPWNCAHSFGTIRYINLQLRHYKCQI